MIVMEKILVGTLMYSSLFGAAVLIIIIGLPLALMVILGLICLIIGHKISELEVRQATGRSTVRKLFIGLEVIIIIISVPVLTLKYTL